MNPVVLTASPVAIIPPTQGIKYTGSKQKLLPHILALIQSVKPRTVFDGFSGTTRVAQALAQSGYTVLANDCAVWSQVFATCYLLNEQPASYYQPLIAHLNQLPPEEGWFTAHYGGDVVNGQSRGADGLKKPWQRHNTQRLDAIRAELDRLTLTPIEKAVLLTSLILALDAVDNTLGHFAAYLHQWAPRSYQSLQLKIPALIPRSAPHQVYHHDILQLLPDVAADLAYFDPPYGSNNCKMPASRVRYAAYYHLWTTICRNDQPPTFGKAQRRCDSSDTQAASVFESFQRNDDGEYIAVAALQQLLTTVNAPHIVLSYNSGGRATAAALHDMINAIGDVLQLVAIDYKKHVMATMRWTHQWVNDSAPPHQEWLFLIKKRD